MNRRRLLGIGFALVALALGLGPAAPSAQAQLPGLPPLPVVNLAPVVNAGLDQVITLPGIATLTGAAIDDGLPIPPVLTTTWSQVSGPGTVSFSNASALISTATFSASGPYVLRLTASDGALAASDDVAVTVNPAPVIPPITDKIAPALLALMQADPQRLLPVIVEMQAPLPPFFGAPNVDRALEALDLLRFNGVAVAPLSLLDSAAGFANAAGIDALSLVPTVAFIHHDATVGPQPSAAPPVPPATADQVSGVYPRVVRADKVWQQGIGGGGVTVAILDSGVAADLDLDPANRILASVNFADKRDTNDPLDPGGHGTHIAGIIAGN